MKSGRKLTKYVLIIASLFALFFVLLPSCPTFAGDSQSIVETTFFGNVQDDGQGCGVFMVLNLVIDILSIGIGIVGVIGITVMGIQYLTASGNEQQIAKAKRRLFEIVIGLVAYVLLYALVQWLLPGGKLNNTTCKTVTDEQLALVKAEEQANKQTAEKKSSKKKSKTKTVTASGLTLSSQIAKTYSPAKMAKLIKQGKLAPSPVCTNCTWRERIAQTAELLAWPKGTKSKYYHYNGNIYNNNYKSWSDLKEGKPDKDYRKALDKLRPNHGFSSMSALGADCGHFVTIVLNYSGHDVYKGKKKGLTYEKATEDYFQNHKWKRVKKAKRGDVCIWRPKYHIYIYLGKGWSAEADHDGKKFGRIVKRECDSSADSIWRVTDKN